MVCSLELRQFMNAFTKSLNVICLKGFLLLWLGGFDVTYEEHGRLVLKAWKQL